MSVKPVTCLRIGSLLRSKFSRNLSLATLAASAFLSGCSAMDDGVWNMQMPKMPTLFHNDPSTAQSIFQQSDADALPKEGETEAKTKEEVPDQLASPSSSWWQAFHNEELNQLIAVAMENNHDLQVAITRIAQAEETARIADAALYPTISNTFSWSGEKQSTTASSGLATSTFYRIPSVGFQASYEADLWGKNGFAASSALALAQASVHYREGVALTLASDLTKSYVDYLAENDHIAVAEDNLSNARSSLQAVRTRMEQGDATQVEALQQETAVANAEAVLHVHHMNQEKSFNKIAACAFAPLRLAGMT